MASPPPSAFTPSSSSSDPDASSSTNSSSTARELSPSTDEDPTYTLRGEDGSASSTPSPSPSPRRTPTTRTRSTTSSPPRSKFSHISLLTLPLQRPPLPPITLHLSDCPTHPTIPSQLSADSIRELHLDTLACATLPSPDASLLSHYLHHFPSLATGFVTPDSLSIALGIPEPHSFPAHHSFSGIPHDQLLTTSRTYLDPRHSAYPRYLRLFHLLHYFFLLREPPAQPSFSNTLLADSFLCLCNTKPYPFHKLIYTALRDRSKRFISQFKKPNTTRFSLPSSPVITLLLRLPTASTPQGTLRRIRTATISVPIPPASPSTSRLRRHKRPRVVKDSPRRLAVLRTLQVTSHPFSPPVTTSPVVPSTVVPSTLPLHPPTTTSSTTFPSTLTYITPIFPQSSSSPRATSAFPISSNLPPVSVSTHNLTLPITTIPTPFPTPTYVTTTITTTSPTTSPASTPLASPISPSPASPVSASPSPHQPVLRVPIDPHNPNLRFPRAETHTRRLDTALSHLHAGLDELVDAYNAQVNALRFLRRDLRTALADIATRDNTIEDLRTQNAALRMQLDEEQARTVQAHTERDQLRQWQASLAALLQPLQQLASPPLPHTTSITSSTSQAPPPPTSHPST